MGTAQPESRMVRQTANPSRDRQHHVEDHRVVVGGRRLKDGAVAVGRHVDGVGLLAQPFGQHMRGVRLVLDQEHPHGWADHSARQVHPRFILASLHWGFTMRYSIDIPSAVARGQAVSCWGRAVFLGVVCVAIASSVRAQGQPRPVVAGVVQDQTGAVLANATVELVSISGATSSVVQSTTADGTGTFRFENVAPGQYELRATYEGFTPASTRLRVGPRPPGAQKLVLAIAGLKQEITVSNAAAEVRRPRLATSTPWLSTRACSKACRCSITTMSRHSHASSTPDRSATAASPSSSTGWKSTR